MFGIHVLKNCCRDDFESLKCWLDHWLSCMLDCIHIYVFFSSWEIVFKQSRQLLDTSSTPGYLSSFSTSSYRNLDSFSTTRWVNRQNFWTLDSFSIAGGLIELLYYLFCWIVPQQILDNCICRSLLCLTPVSTPLDTTIYWDLLNYYIFVQGDLFFILLDISLDLSVLSPPKSLSLTPNFFLKVSSSLFKIFFTW